MKLQKREQLAKLLRNCSEIDQKIKQAIQEALKENKARQNAVAGWDGKKVILVKPHQIKVPNL